MEEPYRGVASSCRCGLDASLRGRLLAACALSLLELLADQPDSSRLGICGGGDYVDDYVDRSPGAAAILLADLPEPRPHPALPRAQLKDSPRAAFGRPFSWCCEATEF